MLFYIYSIVPYAPEFLHSFLFLVTVVKSRDTKRRIYLYSLVLEFSLCYYIDLSDSTICISIFCTVLVILLHVPARNDG